MTVKSNLSLEERIKNTLVPLDEQPYALPENWVWVKFGNLSRLMADGPFGSNLKKEHYTAQKEVRIIQLSNIGEEGWREDNTKYTSFDHAKTISRSIVNAGEIVIAKMMPAGRAIIVPNNEAQYILSSDAVKFVPHKEINTHFLLYGINNTFFRNQVNENTQGITRARTSIGKLKEYSFPLPPLAEQGRIVQRIESLFAKLDTAKECIEASLASFEIRKSALLYQAFTGELTKGWRDKHGVSLDNWKKCTFEEFCFLNRGFDLPAHKRISGKYSLVTSSGTTENHCEYKVKAPGVVTGRSGTIGKVFYIENDYWPLNTTLYSKKTYDNNVKFIYYFIMNFNLKKYSSSTAVPTLNRNNFSEELIIIPTVPEQKEIVCILDALLAKEEQAKAQAQKSLDAINHMKQAILARAFRGELGTHDRADEPAVLLLERILAEEMTTQAQKYSSSKAPKERKARAKAPAIPTGFPQQGREDRVLYLMECLIDEYPNMTMKEIFEMAMLATMPSSWKKLLGKDAAKLTTIMQNHAENWKFSVKEKVRPRRIWSSLEKYHNVIISEQGRCSLRQGYTSERIESYKDLLPFFYNAYRIFCNKRDEFREAEEKMQKMEHIERIA